jgi:lambda repressor-like predicted transcriptional regulator
MPLRKIRGLLYEQGISLKEIALRAGRSHATVRVVMSGHGTSRHIQEVVSKILGIPYKQLWDNHRKAA